MKDVMIDIETLGTGADTIVLSVGAVLFDVDTFEICLLFGATFDIQEQIDLGRKPSAETLKWWMKQDESAKRVFDERSTFTNEEQLTRFSDCLKRVGNEVKVWGNGSTFDITILESLFNTYKVKIPWSFRNVMDLRTFSRFVAKNRKIPRSGVAHNAIDDAFSQAQYVVDTLKENINEKNK